MNCDEVRRKNAIERYVLGRLSEGEKERFERHYFTCDTCFRELQVQLDLREELVGADAPPPAGGTARRRRGFATWLVLAASLALALILGWFLRNDGTHVPGAIAEHPDEAVEHAGAVNEDQGRPPGPGDSDEFLLAELAEISPPDYTPPALRGTEGPGMQRFRKAMEHYARKDFEAAIPLLEEATRLEPDDPGPVFFLGVSCLMTNRLEPALDSLQRTVDLGNTPYLEEALYYLAKAYLREGRIDQAREELRAIVELRGDLEGEAADLLLQLEDRTDAPTH